MLEFGRGVPLPPVPFAGLASAIVPPVLPGTLCAAVRSLTFAARCLHPLMFVGRCFLLPVRRPVVAIDPDRFDPALAPLAVIVDLDRSGLALGFDPDSVDPADFLLGARVSAGIREPVPVSAMLPLSDGSPKALLPRSQCFGFQEASPIVLPVPRQ